MIYYKFKLNDEVYFKSKSTNKLCKGIIEQIVYTKTTSTSTNSESHVINEIVIYHIKGAMGSFNECQLFSNKDELFNNQDICSNDSLYDRL